MPEANHNLQQELETNLLFHETMGKVSAALISAHRSTIDEAVHFLLKEIGHALRVDRSYVFRFAADKKTASNTHEWCELGVSPQKELLQNIPVSFDPWWANKIFTNQTIHIAKVDEMPVELSEMKEFLKSQDIKSTLNVPVFVGKDCWGFIGFDSVKDYRDWSIFQIKYLKIVSSLMSEAYRKIAVEEENLRIHHQLDLAKRMASIGLLSSGMAHEINNPLTILCGSLEVLRSTHQGTGTENIYSKMDHAIQRIAKIIRDLRQFTDSSWKVESKIDITPFIRQEVAQLQDANKVNSIQLEYESDCDSAFVLGNESILRKLLEIIVSNAIDASQSGQKITIKLKALDEHICLLVSDQGRGIKPENRPFLFNAFFTTKDVGKGMGLGLFTAYNMVQLMGGSIEIHSELGVGSTVEMKFPRIGASL